jgi:hypothetical protein
LTQCRPHYAFRNSLGGVKETVVANKVTAGGEWRIAVRKPQGIIATISVAQNNIHVVAMKMKKETLAE